MDNNPAPINNAFRITEKGLITLLNDEVKKIKALCIFMAANILIENIVLVIHFICLKQ